MRGLVDKSVMILCAIDEFMQTDGDIDQNVI